MDNAGYELFTDLCLADYLMTYKFVNTVRFHGKAIPWFVSDVTSQDFKATIDSVAHTSKSETLKELGKRWEGYFKSGMWIRYHVNIKYNEILRFIFNLTYFNNEK